MSFMTPRVNRVIRNAFVHSYISFVIEFSTRLTADRAGMHRTDVLRMVKRRAHDTTLPDSTCCHTFRATGITAYLDNGGTR